MLMWEYKIVGSTMGLQPKREEQLNELGKEGWMLVAVIDCGSGSVTFYLKRPKDKIYQDVNSVSPNPESR